MEKTLANPAEPRRRPAARPMPFKVNDFVLIQRDFIAGQHRVASGSIGAVTVIHENQRLLDVQFPSRTPVTLTIAAYELKHATR